VVFHGELEVGQCDGDARRYDDQDDEHKEQNPKQGVRIAAPHTRVDVEQLDVYRTERQKASHDHLHGERAIPRNRGDLTREVLGPARSVEGTSQSFAGDTTSKSERETDTKPDEKDLDDGQDGDGGGDLVDGGDGVDEGGDDEKGAAEEGCRGNHVPRPALPAHLFEER